MRYFFDTEFIEYPHTIDLVSIGIVAEDGRELYLISSEFDASKAHPWVKENVLDKLESEEDVPRKTQDEICEEILDFIGDETIGFVGDDPPEFWAAWAAYDWVVFCWIFGAMVDLPKGWPMYCRDLIQWSDQMNILEHNRLASPEGEHNALVDAKWNKKFHEFLVAHNKTC